MNAKAAVSNYDLKSNIIALWADIKKTNVGYFSRMDKENMVLKFKFQSNGKVIYFCCIAHIIHNCAKTAFESMPADTEVLITKFLMCFHMYTVHIERLRDLFLTPPHKIIVTDFIHALPGNRSVNRIQHATIDDAVFFCRFDRRANRLAG
jgi:hypothetical protein